MVAFIFSFAVWWALADAALALYLLPLVVAWHRGVRDRKSVAVLNIAGG